MTGWEENTDRFLTRAAGDINQQRINAETEIDSTNRQRCQIAAAAKDGNSL
jgi:hypothetical protein